MKVLVTNQPEEEAMETAKALGCKSISYGELPHLFGNKPLPFVYDEDEVDFTKDNNQCKQLKKGKVKKQVPVMDEIEQFNEDTGQWETVQVDRRGDIPKTRYRLTNPELGKDSPVEEYTVYIKGKIYEEIEVDGYGIVEGEGKP